MGQLFDRSPSSLPPETGGMAAGLLLFLLLFPAGCGDDPLTYAELTLPGPVYLQADAAEVEFGETLVVGGAQIPLTISNPDSSESALTFQAAVGDGPFTLANPGGSLAPGEVGEILIRFTPVDTGPSAGRISISHNAGNFPNPFEIAVRGSGTRTKTFDGNPLFWAADPAGHVWYDDKMWVYATTDMEDWDDLEYWNAWSSPDLKTWTVHERIFGATDCGWCVNNAWAPDIAYKGGKYYLYYYFRNDGVSPGGVGVAVSDHPAGPFQNLSLDGPLVDGHDPAVFVDDDGQAYLYPGHIIYLLNPDMVSLKEVDGRPLGHVLELQGHQPIGGWESLWVFKRGDTYYLSLADEDYRQLRYYMGKSPLGPFVYAGMLLDRASGMNIHHSIVPFRDRWVLFYHLWDPEGPGHRRVHGEFLSFNEDGTIRSVDVSNGGVAGDSLPPLGRPLLFTESEALDFGETLILGGEDRSLWMMNPDSSGATLRYDAEVEEGDFELVRGRGSLAPGTTGRIVIRFKPGAQGPASALLSIYHNASNKPNPLHVPVSGLGSTSQTFEGNPLFWAADPAGHVWPDGQMWIYPTTDQEDGSQPTHWNAWSSPDLKTWTVHQNIFSAEDCDWCVRNAWAPDVAYRDGRYFFYFYFGADEEHPGGIGVAVSDQPQGPFSNRSLDAPLADGHDPAIFVDDDGKAYLFAGSTIYFLAPNMVSLETAGAGPRQYPLLLSGHTPVDGWESLWVFKREGRYYLTLVDEDYRQIRYYMGSAPTGPFQYAGTLLEKAEGVNIHHSIVPFEDRWVLWYHLWPHEGPGNRRIYGELLTFNEDGTIQPVFVSEDGVTR